MSVIVEVYADVACPFAYVGLRRTAAYRDAHAADVVLRVLPWPLELVNGEPLDPAAIANEVEDLRDAVAPDLFAHYRKDALPASSMPAFVFVAAAGRESPALAEAAAFAVRRALFEDGLDVGDPAVLSDVARRVGVPWPPPDTRALEAEVLAAYGEGRRRGVLGSPHFFAAGGDVFCPVITIERTGDRRRLYVDEPAVAAFFASIMG